MVGVTPRVAELCVQLPLAQLKVASAAFRLVAPDAYTCELSVLIKAAPHEPPDVSVHVAVKVMGAGVTPAAQLTGPPGRCCAQWRNGLLQ